jgi:hypothetical protein
VALSGSTTFNLDFVEAIEEAYERCGLEVRGGYDLATARRSINLLFIEWGNEGINLWTLEEREQVLSPSDGDYVLGADVVDVIEHHIEDSSGRISTLSRVPLAAHTRRVNPSTEGKPREVFVDRGQAAPIAHLWPLPNSSTYTMVYWVLRRIEDAGDYTNNADIPFRFLPAFIAGLAWKLAGKKKSSDIQLLTRLRAEYNEAFKMAKDEDRDRSPMRIVPRIVR